MKCTWQNKPIELGDHWVIDDQTGDRVKASETVKGVGLEQGQVMHYKNASPYDPQLHIRPRPDNQFVTPVRTQDTYNWRETDEDSF
jgi:hypothetical protein